MKSIQAIAVLAFFSLALFGGGVFLHGSRPAPAPALTAGPSKTKPGAHHASKTALSKTAPSKPAVPGPENPSAFPLMLLGGAGLLASALASLGVCRSLAADPRPGSRARPSQDAHLPARLRDTEQAARDRQRELEARQTVLEARLAEANQHKAETESLREQVSRQFQEFFRTLPVPCFCFAANGRIIRWNAACEALYGLPAAAALEQTLWEAIVPDSEREEAEAKIYRVLAGESLLGAERWDTVAGGAAARLRCSMVPLRDADGQIIGGLSAGVDVTEYARQEEQIASLTAALEAAEALTSGRESADHFTDHLEADPAEPGSSPELRGHPAFRARLAEEVERAARYHAPLSVILLDLDNFAACNKTFGFEAGDAALQAAVAVIKTKIRSVDTIARLGADEYALILPETGEAGTRIAAERLRAGLAVGGKKAQTACFGAVQLSPDVSGAEELIYRAAAALADARAAGPNTIVHYQDMTPADASPKVTRRRSPQKKTAGAA